MSKISREEPVTELRRIKIKECGEPMVDFLQECPRLVLDTPRFNYRRETLLRRGVLERLCRAVHSLPSGYGIAVVEGWRAPFIQQRMYLAIWQRFQKLHPDWSEHKLKRVVNRYSAPMDTQVPPPHTTGGAIDLLLTDGEGKALDHTGPFDPYDALCYSFDAKGISAEARANRDRLAEALLAQGITNYPSEFWHWSYGDQGWAYRGGEPFAIYGPITPPDWSPDLKDDTGEPLEFLV